MVDNLVVSDDPSLNPVDLNSMALSESYLDGIELKTIERKDDASDREDDSSDDDEFKDFFQDGFSALKKECDEIGVDDTSVSEKDEQWFQAQANAMKVAKYNWHAGPSMYAHKTVTSAAPLYVDPISEKGM